AVGVGHPGGQVRHVDVGVGGGPHAVGCGHDVAVVVVLEADGDPVGVGQRPEQAVDHLDLHLPAVGPGDAGRERAVVGVVEGEPGASHHLVAGHPAGLVVLPALLEPAGAPHRCRAAVGGELLHAAT